MGKPLICEVCYKYEAMGVVSSGLMPYSMRICNKCLHQNAEPRFIVESCIKDCGGLDAISKEVKDHTYYYDNGIYRAMKDFK